jgi:hypothetical protein
VCLHLSAQPTWPQLFRMFVCCLLSFLHLPSPPVRFLGQAHVGHERWHLNRYLTTGNLKPEMRRHSEKHDKKQVRLEEAESGRFSLCSF